MRTKRLIAVCALLILFGLAGCASNPKPKSGADAVDELLGKKGQGSALPADKAVVKIVGPVKYPVIRWTPGLTLKIALVAAEYSGNDPSEIAVVRVGQRPVYMTPKQLGDGQDLLLEAGDIIEFRP